MAGGRDVAERSLEDLEKEITCAVCQEHYTDPKILPCLHYYCKQCIIQLAARTGKGKPFSCPECRMGTKLPEGGVEEFRSAFFVNRLKSMYDKHKKALNKQAYCEVCSGNEAKAEAYCQQCDKFVCKSCVQIHSKGNFEGHKIVPVDEMHKVGAEVVQKNSPLKKCPSHGEVSKIICFDCEELICGDCIVKGHRGHTVEFVEIAADKKKNDLINKLMPLRKVEDSLTRALKELHDTEHEIEIQGDSLANTIKTSFEELHTILETRKQQLLEEVKRKVSEKVKNLKGQEENLSVASVIARSVIEYTEQCVTQCSDYEIMNMHAGFSRQIEQEIENHREITGKILEPVDKADIGVEVRCAENLQQLCQTKANIVLVPMKVEIDKAIVNEDCEAFLQLKRKNKAANSMIEVECQSKFNSSEANITTNIQQVAYDKYRILFKSSIRGQHQLSISVSGMPVMGSPFPVTVTISPTRLDKPVKVWENIHCPVSFAVNSAGEIIVVENERNILRLDKDGKQLSCIDYPQHQMKHLRAVSIDNLDNIYYIDYNSNKIGKANWNCETIHVREVLQVNGLGHLDIAVVGEEVMVTECKNKGQITVYDRELNYVRLITGRGKTRLRCLSPDRYQNLYITDDDKNIQVLSKTGDFLHLITCYEKGVKQLKDPWMVHVTSQYVYVADVVLNKTMVFTTKGKYVTRVSCYGGIVVDKDGLVYISNFFKNKINCY